MRSRAGGGAFQDLPLAQRGEVLAAFDSGFGPGAMFFRHVRRDAMTAFYSTFEAYAMLGYRGPPIDVRIWDMAHPGASRPPGRGGYVLGVSGTMGGWHGPVSYATRTPGFGAAHKRAVR